MTEISDTPLAEATNPEPPVDAEVVESPVDGVAPHSTSPEATTATEQAKAKSPEPTASGVQAQPAKKPKAPRTSEASGETGRSEKDGYKAMSEKLSSLESLLVAEQEARAQAEADLKVKAEAARMQWLKENGIAKESFGTLAPNIQEADPFTEEGRRVLSKFRSENPELFKGTPERPKVPDLANIGGRRKTFGEMFREAINR